MHRRASHESTRSWPTRTTRTGRLLEGGTTPRVQPYLVMELVDGLAIDAHCASMALDLPQRLALLDTVCAAVEHAHRDLVIHGDIKPDNARVTARLLRRRWAWVTDLRLVVGLTAAFTGQLARERDIAQAERQRAENDVQTTRETARLLTSLTQRIPVAQPIERFRTTHDLGQVGAVAIREVATDQVLRGSGGSREHPWERQRPLTLR